MSGSDDIAALRQATLMLAEALVTLSDYTTVQIRMMGSNLSRRGIEPELIAELRSASDP